MEREGSGRRGGEREKASMHIYTRTQIRTYTSSDDAETDRQTDRQTNKQTNRQLDRQTDRQTDGQTDRQTDGQTDLDGRTEMDRQRWTDRPTERQTDRQTDRQIDTFGYNFSPALVHRSRSPAHLVHMARNCWGLYYFAPLRRTGKVISHGVNDRVRCHLPLRLERHACMLVRQGSR